MNLEITYGVNMFYGVPDAPRAANSSFDSVE